MRFLVIGAILISLAATVTGADLVGVISMTDEATAELPGVTVSASSVETREKCVTVSDQYGVYRFATLSPGEYDIRAEMDGLLYQTKRVCLETSRRVDFYLLLPEFECICVRATPPPGQAERPLPPPPPLVVSGVVLDEFGAPVRKAEVTIFKDGRQSIKVRTDQNGYFQTITRTKSVVTVYVSARSCYPVVIRSKGDQLGLTVVLHKRCS